MKRYNIKAKGKVCFVAVAVSATLMMPGQMAFPTVSYAEDTTVASADASAEPTILGSGVGIALMEGETMSVSLDDSTTVYIPFTLDKQEYVSLYRNDDSGDAVSFSILDENKKQVVAPKKMEWDDTTTMKQLAKGQYYVCVTGNVGSTCEIKLKRSQGKELKMGSTNSISLGKHKSSDSFYLQYTASKTGYLSIENKAGSKVSVCLCNTSKKSLTGTKSLASATKKNKDDGKTTTGYGVVKGKKYLLRVKAASSVKTAKIKPTIKSYSTVGGSSFSKAKTLVKSKTAYATMGAGAKTCYYTFKKTSYSSKSIKINTLKNQGKIRFTLYYKEVKGKNKGKILPVKVQGKTISWTVGSEYSYQRYIPSDWPKVTYYLKVSNDSKTSSGCYRIVVK